VARVSIVRPPSPAGGRAHHNIPDTVGFDAVTESTGGLLSRCSSNRAVPKSDKGTVLSVAIAINDLGLEVAK